MENEEVEGLEFEYKFDNLKKKKMLDAMISSYCIVTNAAKKAGITRALHYHWLEKDEEYAKAIEDAKETSIDFVESQLFSKVKELDTTSIIFFLKTRGKKRGYVEKENFDTNLKITIEESETNINDDFEE